MSVLQVYWVAHIWSSSYVKYYKVDDLTDLIKKISISEGLDRCVDDFTNINEDMVVDQTGSHQLMENRPKEETEAEKEIVKGPENILRKDCSIRDQFLWLEEASCIKD